MNPGKEPICKRLPIRVEVNGENVLKKSKRGFKLIILDSHSGRVDQIRNVDTWVHVNSANLLDHYLMLIPRFKIVVGVVWEEILHVSHRTKRMIVSRISFDYRPILKSFLTSIPVVSTVSLSLSFIHDMTSPLK